MSAPELTPAERTASTRRLKVFLCHASDDSQAVLKLYDRLLKDGFAPWIDKKNLTPGADWERAIEAAVAETDVLLVCLSKKLQKRRWANKEIKLALDQADMMPGEETFLIPVRLENCDVPSRLARWQAANLFEADGYQLLRATLQARQDELQRCEAAGEPSSPAVGESGEAPGALAPRAAGGEHTKGSAIPAAELLDPAPERSGAAFARFARQAANEGRTDEALRLALRAVERLPADAAVLSDAARFAAAAGRLQTAASLAERVVTVLERGDPPGGELAPAQAELAAYRARLAQSVRHAAGRYDWMSLVARRAHLRLVAGPARDYAWAVLFGVLPMGTALLAGVERTLPATPELREYTGYFSTHWIGFAVFLPVALYLTRRALKCLVPTYPNPPRTLSEVPPILKVTGLHPGASPAHETDAASTPASTAQVEVFHLLGARLGSARVVASAAVIAAAITCLDAKEVLTFYANHMRGLSNEIPREADWSVMFLRGEASPALNLVHVGAAYAAQNLLTFIAFVLCLTFFVHNQFFLTRVFQRRIHEWKDADVRVTINPNDKDQCFGFSPTYSAFNTQVSYLFYGGLILLTSRWANVEPSFVDGVYALNLFAIAARDPAALAGLVGLYKSGALFPDVGQWLIACGWLVFLGVVSLPAMVKFLPLMPRPLLWVLRLGNVDPVQPYLAQYLREFFPLSSWKALGASDDEIAGKVLSGLSSDGPPCGFKHQSFWPTGDNKAFRLFLFAFTIFAAILLPLPPPRDWSHLLEFLLFYSILVACGLLMTTALFGFMRWSLRWVHADL